MAHHQPGQPTSGNPKKFNWSSFIVSTLLIVGLVVLAWWLFFGFGSRKNAKDVTTFNQRVTINAENTSDKNYFERVEFNRYNHQIYVIEVVDNKKEDYVVSADPILMNDYLKEGILSELLEDAVKGSPHEVKIISAGPPTENRFVSALFTLLPALLLIGFFVWMMRKSGGITDSIMSPGKSQAKKIISKKRFSDVAGQEEAKEEIVEVVDFLKHPQKYRAAGARVPKGILFGGPPGTGKTLLAKATAGEAGVPFFFISGSNFVEMFAGLGAKRVREMFKESRKAAPAILFIDELDAIGRKRGSSLSGNDEREQTLNQILVEMDGMEENAGLLIIAATNRPDVLDPALLRPGRFDRTITVNNPDVKEREAILSLHAKGKRIASNVSFKSIAKRTPGYSGAQLENIINEAALLSVRENTNIITLEQIDEAIDRVAAGPAKKHRVITPKELRMIAYHEAGHAVIGLKVASAEKVQKITIIPRGHAGGYTLMTPREEKYNYSKSELEAKIISFMGGRAAEQIMYGMGEVSTGASNDIEKATSIARAMVTQYGMSDLGPIAYERDYGPQYLGQDYRAREYSDALAERIDEAVRKLIMLAEQKAIATLKVNRDLLDLIAEELLEKETIVSEEIEYIHKFKKRPPHKIKPAKILESDKSLEEIIKEIDAKVASKKEPKTTKTAKTTKKQKEPSSKKDKRFAKKSSKK
ncbi:ATP-dependent zinc metalloprotease FtsH [Mycoplasma sp. ATU-Cv-508]|uniref:ATP-dependent zinc metalloprotease FtsH n=1 Tax=Mycoplasma sp. ATU-Cv-508 TaxID=2048001 RepID=UPI000FDEF56C